MSCADFLESKSVIVSQLSIKVFGNSRPNLLLNFSFMRQKINTKDWKAIISNPNDLNIIIIIEMLKTLNKDSVRKIGKYFAIDDIP